MPLRLVRQMPLLLLVLQVCAGVGVSVSEGVGWCADLLPGPTGPSTGGAEVHTGISVHRYVPSSALLTSYGPHKGKGGCQTLQGVLTSSRLAGTG
jgi:hypothetical protein